MYPGNHTDSDILYAPRYLKTRPGAPRTHLAYITDDEAGMLQQYKPGTPHEGPHDIPNYDTWGYDPSGGGTVYGGSTADGGGAWSGDVGGTQTEPEPWSGSENVGNVQDDITENLVTTQDVTPTSQKIKDENVLKLATLEASDPKYAKSFEGQKMIKAGWGPGTEQWIQKFGMPSIVAMPTYASSDYGWEAMRSSTTGDYLYTELGKNLMGLRETSGQDLGAEAYSAAKDKYWTETRPEEDLLAGQGENNYGYGYDYNPGSYTVSGGYGYGYGGDPNELGKTPFYGEPYSEARYAPLDWHKRMVNVNSPLYAARGGIMSLRR